VARREADEVIGLLRDAGERQARVIGEIAPGAHSDVPGVRYEA